jgi:hypothetical protein
MYEGSTGGLNDFVLKTHLLVDWYVQVTGDLDFLEEVYPNYRHLLEDILHKRNDRGYYPSGRVFIEWTRIDKNADLTAYQALLSRSFRIQSVHARLLGLDEDARLFGEEAGRLARLVPELYFDPEAGVYRDGFKSGNPLDHHYPISSVYPLLFDLAPEDQKPGILAYLEEELKDIGEESRNRKITPYGSFYLFSALYREGRADLAEQFMLQYWSRMIHQGDDTSWENFDIGGEDGGGQGTASHAWSGHPTFFLSTEVLGVNLGFTRPLDPSIVEIRPRSASLQWARGWVPHPAGMVYVSWAVKGDQLHMELRIPEGVEYRLEPSGRLAGLDLEADVKISDPFSYRPDQDCP